MTRTNTATVRYFKVFLSMHYRILWSFSIASRLVLLVDLLWLNLVVMVISQTTFTLLNNPKYLLCRLLLCSFTSWGQSLSLLETSPIPHNRRRSRGIVGCLTWGYQKQLVLWNSFLILSSVQVCVACHWPRSSTGCWNNNLQSDHQYKIFVLQC